MARKNGILVGLGGGSGSGKSTLAKRLRDRLGADRLTILEMDSFYREDPTATARDRAVRNYDHPDALDWELLLETLRQLRAGEDAEIPVYDFGDHRRADSTVVVPPTPVILVEGILCLVHEPLRQLLDLSVFVDTEPDIRFIRRLRRDILDRDRSIDSVVNQYLETVRPMYSEYVAPSRYHADIVIPEGTGDNELGVPLMVEALAHRLETMLAEG